MDESFLAEQFEQHRGQLKAVAYRMLGRHSDVEDAVQEAWLRLSRAGQSEQRDIENLGAWLTTVVGRVCLDMLRARKSRKEDAFDQQPETPNPFGAATSGDPEQQAIQTDSVGLALLVVLDTLAPAERLAFVLHDMFTVPFEEIAPIVGKTATATRQLASRARRRVQGADAPAADLARQRSVVDAFLSASRGGDFQALLSTLDPDVMLRADSVAVATAATAQAKGAPTLTPQVTGANQVATAFSGRARTAQPALVNGVPGAIWAQGGVPRAVFAFSISGNTITAIDLIGDPARIADLTITLL